MTREDKLKPIFQLAMKTQNKTVKQAAVVVGFSESTMYHMFQRGTDTWDMISILKLGKWLNIPIDILRKAISFEGVRV